MTNDNKPDKLQQSILDAYQILDRERRVMLGLCALNLLEEWVKQKQKERRDEEFNRQIKAAAVAKLYIC